MWLNSKGPRPSSERKVVVQKRQRNLKKCDARALLSFGLLNLACLFSLTPSLPLRHGSLKKVPTTAMKTSTAK